MTTAILAAILLLLVATVALLLARRGEAARLRDDIARLEQTLREENRHTRDADEQRSRRDREELAASLAAFRQEHQQALRDISSQVRQAIGDFRSTFAEHMAAADRRQQESLRSTEKRLDEMRATVDEKLQRTLNERIGQSFLLVGRQLENVQKGLGEMQTLAQDVGSLKRVLGNVKIRGTLGEVQLAMLLDQLLAPDQYEANARPRPGSDAVVEFAIKLPGKDDASGPVYLPVDSKFPKDVYERLLDAYDSADPARVEAASRTLEQTVRGMARNIRDKYLAPPHTTDFGIMFLPFEGIYGEVTRRAALLEQLQREYRVVVTGPTTLAALLNSLQMGFRTLALQRRGSEVWRVLGEVKTEFAKFATLLEKAQKNLQTAGNQLEEVMGKRTRAIQRRLRDVEAVAPGETPSLPSSAPPSDDDLS